MAEILLLHHARGRTPGVLALAERLAAEGHTVHTPDLYDRRTFASVEEGVAHAQELGVAIDQRVDAAVAELPLDLVYVGWSLGVMPAQRLAQNRPGARAAVLLEGFVPPHFFGVWPAGLPAQIHGALNDPVFAGEGDLAAAAAFVAGTDTAELFTYPGDEHLFADSSLPSYDGAATVMLQRRLLEFLGRVG